MGTEHVSTLEHSDGLEGQIARWRSYLRRRQAIHAIDVEELEDHLRGQVTALVDAGLTTDEAFLVAVKRMGDLDELSAEFAREYSERLWKQLIVAPDIASERSGEARTEAFVVVGLAAIAAMAVKVPELFGRDLFGEGTGFYARNFSFFVLPVLTGYFTWKRRLHRRSRWPLAAGVWTSFGSRASCSSTTCSLPLVASFSPVSRWACSNRSAWTSSGWRRPGCCRVARWGPSSSVPGWWRRSRV